MSLYKKNKILKIESKYESKFLNVFEVFYKNKLNQEKKWFVASRKNKADYYSLLNNDKEYSPDAVLIVGLSRDRDKLVLIREYRVPINDYIYSLPAGLIDKGEDLYQSAVREMKEETGLDLFDIDEELTVKNAFASVGMSDESLAIVYGRVDGSISSQYQEDSEEIEALLVTKDEAKSIIESGKPIDIKALLAIRDFIGDNLCTHI